MTCRVTWPANFKWNWRFMFGRGRRQNIFFQVIEEKNRSILDSRRKQTKANAICNISCREILWKLQLMCFTPFNGNACKSQLYYVDVLEIVLIFCEKLKGKLKRKTTGEAPELVSTDSLKVKVQRLYRNTRQFKGPFFAVWGDGELKRSCT